MNFRIDRFLGCLAVFFMVEGPGVWVSSELISNFDFAQVWVSSKFDQTLIFKSLSLILKVWFYSNFEFWNSKFRQTLSFQSLSFVKVWLYKLIVLPNFDSNVTTLMKVKVYKSNFDKTKTLKTQSLTKLGVSKLKVWEKSDFQNQSLIKLWSNSDFWKSKFDEALMKLRLSKFKVWSNFDETQTLFWTLLFFHTQLFLFSWNIDCPSHISKKIRNAAFAFFWYWCKLQAVSINRMKIYWEFGCWQYAGNSTVAVYVIQPKGTCERKC